MNEYVGNETTRSPSERAPVLDERWITALLFFVALVPRLYVSLAWAREPVWDGFYYHFGATQIASGFGYADSVNGSWHPWCHYPVGYSAFLGLMYKIFGTGLKVAPVANAVVGSVLVALIHRAALPMIGTTRARLAAVLVAMSPELIVYSALLMTEPLASLAVPAAIVAMLYARTNPATAWRGRVIAGIALGLGTLVRPQTVLSAPAVLLIDLSFESFDAFRKSLRNALVSAAAVTATCLLVVAPWTARNCNVMDGCAFVSTNAGWNLAIGAFPRATGRFETLRATDGCPVVTGQVQQDRCWGELGASYIKNDTTRWLSLMPKKLAFTFDHASFPMGYLGESNRDRFPEERKAEGRSLLKTAHGAMMALSLFAAVAWPFRRARTAVATGSTSGWMNKLRANVDPASLITLVGLIAFVAWVVTRDEPPLWWLAVAVPIAAVLPIPGRAPLGPGLRYVIFTWVAVALTHAVFFGEDRYHVVLTPLMSMLAAASLRPSVRRDETAASYLA